MTHLETMIQTDINLKKTQIIMLQVVIHLIKANNLKEAIENLEWLKKNNNEQIELLEEHLK